MFVAILFIPVVAGNMFLGSEFRRLPKISERNNPPKKSNMLSEPCNMNKVGKQVVSCSQLGRRGENENTELFISPHNKVHVKCDMETDGGGWTIIQRRGKYEYDKNLFKTSMQNYEKGFGEALKSYWIGNMNLHALTAIPSNPQVLRIELTKSEGDNITVEYDQFEVGSQADEYKLTIGNYNGPDGYDALRVHNGHTFMIGSEDYTMAYTGCYPLRSGGWWYNDCVRSNLNGEKFRSGQDEQNTKGLGITWSRKDDKTPYNDYYEVVEMKIRDADFKLCTGKMAN